MELRRGNIPKFNMQLRDRNVNLIQLRRDIPTYRLQVNENLWDGHGSWKKDIRIIDTNTDMNELIGDIDIKHGREVATMISRIMCSIRFVSLE